MDVIVEYSPSTQIESAPAAIIVNGTRLRVLGVASTWCNKDTVTYKIRAQDGHQYLLKHDVPTELWTLVKRFTTDA